MKIYKSYKVRLKVRSRELEQKLWTYAGHCRFIWNYFWRINKYRLENRFPIMWFYEMGFYLTLLKKSEEYSFLNECPRNALNGKLMDLERAYKDAFDKKQLNKKMPKIRKKGAHDSFRLSGINIFKGKQNTNKTSKMQAYCFL